MGYFAVPFSNALACAKNTDGDSLTFLTDVTVFVIITLQSAWDMTQKRGVFATHQLYQDIDIDFVQHVTILEENVCMQTPHHVYDATPISVSTS